MEFKLGRDQVKLGQVNLDYMRDIGTAFFKKL